MRTSRPVDLCRQTGVGIGDPRFNLAIDVAVVGRGDDGQDRGREQRVRSNDAEWIRRQCRTNDDSLRAVVACLHVVGNDGDLHILVRCKFYSAASAIAFVAIDFAAVKDIGHVTVVIAMQQRYRAAQGIRLKFARSANAQPLFVALKIRHVNIALGIA